MSVERAGRSLSKGKGGFNAMDTTYGSGFNPSGSQVKFTKVEKAKEFESYRQLPKYSHVPLACIHPSPRKKRTPPREASPTIIVAA